MKKDRAEVYQNIIEILRPVGVQRISIFGSYARHEETQDSDIDILVKLKSPSKRKPIGLKWFSLDQEISKKIGRRVDLVSEDAVPASLKDIVERDAELIYEEAG